MLLQSILQILDWIASFFTMALLARVLMQWSRAPFRNPLGEFVLAVTDWAIRPTRRFIPSAYGLDLAGLLLAWLTQIIFQCILHALWGIPDLLAIGTILLLALIGVLRTGIYLLIGVVIVGALFSWVNPFAPLAPLFNALAHPFLRPLQRVIPPIGNVDLSPLVLLLILQLLLGMLASLQISAFR